MMTHCNSFQYIEKDVNDEKETVRILSNKNNILRKINSK